MGVKVAASTAWEILRNAGIDPAPRLSGPTWSQFLRSQAQAILACDLFTVDLLNGTQAHVLAVIEHATRRIRILGVTLHPTGEWTTQQARNLLMDLGGQADRVKFMIRDRGSNFAAAFDAVLADAGIQIVLCNVRTPRRTRRRWCSLTISIWSISSRRRVPIILSQIAFARGACGGLARILMPLGVEQGVERAGVLARAVPDQELD